MFQLKMQGILTFLGNTSRLLEEHLWSPEQWVGTTALMRPCNHKSKYGMGMSVLWLLSVSLFLSYKINFVYVNGCVCVTVCHLFVYLFVCNKKPVLYVCLFEIDSMLSIFNESNDLFVWTIFFIFFSPIKLISFFSMVFCLQSKTYTQTKVQTFFLKS